jgi:predicted DNA-binding transcriptional regulator AlpA
MVSVTDREALLDDKQVAEMLRLKNPKTLAIWRSRRRFLDLLPPVYVGRCVRYRQSSVENFISARTRKSAIS